MKDDLARSLWKPPLSSRNIRILAFSVFTLFGVAILLSVALITTDQTNNRIITVRDVLLFIVAPLSFILAFIALRRWNRAQREINRRESIEEQFRQLAENIEATFWLYDLNREQLLYVSPGFRKLLGLSSNDQTIDWRTFLDTIHPGGLEYIDRISKSRNPPDHVNETFFRFYWPNGTMHWIHSRIFAVLDESGTANRLVGIAENITERRQTEEELQRANLRLKEWAERLQRRNQEITRLGEMGKLLQACASHEEAYTIIAESAANIFSDGSGALFARQKSQDQFSAVATWNDPTLETSVFSKHQCWALRSGDSHVVAYSGMLCQHLGDHSPNKYMCIPILAQDTPLGVLHLQMPDSVDESLMESHERMAIAMADQVALALSNLNLRKRLSALALRDSLTGLYNRRYMEVALEHEIRRVRRQRTSLGVIMMDLDNFKQFNDTYGHGAGDMLLRQLGTFLRTHVRSADIACRYGGEEFVVILPSASIEETRVRGEQLRQEFQTIEFQYEGETLDGVTLSAGVAVYPHHGETGARLLQVADDALYQAKADGRNCLVIASVPER